MQPQKDREREGEGMPSRSKLSVGVRAAWGLVVLFVLSLVIVTGIGLWGRLLLEFFLLGWELVGE